MELTLGQAAKQVGVSKPTLSKAIKTGRLSGTRHEDGSYAINAAELQRYTEATVMNSLLLDIVDRMIKELNHVGPICTSPPPAILMPKLITVAAEYRGELPLEDILPPLQEVFRENCSSLTGQLIKRGVPEGWPAGWPLAGMNEASERVKRVVRLGPDRPAIRATGVTTGELRQILQAMRHVFGGR